MLAEVDSRTISEWQVYDSIEPIGDRRLDYLFAYLVASTANLHRGRDDKAVDLQDCLIDWWANEPGQVEEPQSLDEQRSIIEILKLVFERPSPPEG